jgi:hypothetical protein
MLSPAQRTAAAFDRFIGFEKTDLSVSEALP